MEKVIGLSTVGAQVSRDEAGKMVKDFQDANPTANTANFVGRDILLRILSQPDCVGIRFYSALDRNGWQTLVYVGVNSQDQAITEYLAYSFSEGIHRVPGIIADRTVMDPNKEYWQWNVL